MKVIVIILNLILLLSWARAENLNLADIGFDKSDHYIGIEFSGAQEIEYQFSLCKTSTGECAKFNGCKYKESLLVDKLSASENEKFKNEFNWIFLRSGKSVLEIKEFYLEFSQLLKRVAPECKVPSLEDKVGVT